MVGTAGVAAVITTGPPVVTLEVEVEVVVGMFTVYTPTPPTVAVVVVEEAAKPVIKVPGGTPGPEMALPTASVPLPTEVTVRVVPARDATMPEAAMVAAAAGTLVTVCVVGAATE